MRTDTMHGRRSRSSLRIKVSAVAIPVGETRTVYDAWLWHNEVTP